MSKALKTDKLNSRPVVRTLVAVSLSISLAAFGCTTDRTLGNGDPVVTPGVRTSPTGNTSSGSETTPSVPGPMFSSSIDNGQALPAVRPRASRADQAAAVIAGQAPRVRYLGVTMPGMSGRVYHSDGLVTGAFQNPALRTNPQLTVNSSISSAPTPVIASGAGEGVGSGDAAAAAVLSGTSFASTTGASVIGTTGVTTGTTAASTATGTGVNLGGNANGGAAPIFAPGSAASPTAATTLPLGTLASTATPTTSPTAFSALNPPTAISNFPALAANSTVTQSALAANGVAPATNGTVFTGTDNTANTNTAAATSAATTAAATATDTATTARARSGLNATARATTPAPARGTSTVVTSDATATGTGTAGRTATNPVRVTRDANGRVTITNVNAQRNQ